MFTDSRIFVFSNALVKVSGSVTIFVEELSWHVSRMAHMTNRRRAEFTSAEEPKIMTSDEILFKILWRMEVTLLLDCFLVIFPKLL